jgi:methyl-accepting chemotaxis protein
MNTIIVMLGHIHPSIATLQGGPLCLFLLVMSLTLVFFIFYLIKGCQVGSSLWLGVRAIRALRRPNNPPDPAEVAMVLSSQPLTQLWDDYTATLHVLHNTVRKTSSSALILSEFRSTVRAATIFTRENLVDGRLLRGFTRHLPGLLIGLGIVGALLSLLGAIPDPWSAPEPGLWMAGVEHALVVAASGIACALLVLFFGQLMLAGFHGLANQLQHAIDGLYASGAHEDYLARLVQASEAGTAQIAQLKEALMVDLSATLGKLAQQQMASHDDAMQALGQRLADAIAATLALPMQRIGDAMEHTAKGNAEQLAALLESLSNAFMIRLEQAFGGQLLGLHEHMQASTATMSVLQTSLQGLLDNVARVSAQATDQMSDKLEAAMAVLALARSHAVSDERERSERLSLRASELLGGLASQVDTLLGAAADQGRQTQGSIDALGQVALQAIDGMNQGAQAIDGAAKRFETAGNAVGAIFERSADVSDQLSAVSQTLQQAATAVQRGFDQYDAIRITVDAQVAALMDLVESAKQEAGVSQELVADLKASAAAMRVAEDASRKHLEGVNDALFKAFSDFGNAMVSQVKSTIAETDRHLAQGTGHLNGVILELSNAVSRIRQGDA